MESEMMNRRLTDGSVGSHLVKLSLPMLFNILTVVAFNLTDTYFVAQLGTNELAAMSLTFPVIATLASLTMGLGDGAGAVLAIAIGEGNRQKVKQLNTDGLVLSLIIGIVITFAALTSINSLFTALGAKGEVLALAKEYMSIWYLGVIFLVVSSITMNTIRALGEMKVLSLIVLTSSLINIVLDPLFIFGKLGFPRLELAGAAISTVVAQGTILLGGLMFLHHDQLMGLAPSKLGKVWKSWWQILYLGIPAAAKNAISPISLGLITSMVSLYGAQAIAAFGIASRLESLVMIVFFALSAAIAPLVGQNWGAGKFKRVNRAFSLSLRFCVIWGVAIALVLAFTASGFASIFNKNQEVIKIVSTYMAIVPISYAAAGIVLIASSTFIALGKPLPSVAMTLAHTLVVYIPLAHLGKFLWGINGIFIGACLANLIVGLGAIIWQRQSLKHQSQVRNFTPDNSKIQTSRN
ncbi:MAG: MATE family efflux transporter [Waterburya sp.]